MRLRERVKLISPGALVTAAFIGPGTITTCIKAGYTQSFSLLSVMIIATIIAIIIQYYSAKVGIITQCGISRNIRLHIKSKYMRACSILLIICAVFIGNCAFEAGNITGAAIGLQLFFDAPSSRICILITTALAGLLLWKGQFSLIQNAMKYLVMLMAICFVVASIIVKPDITHILSEMLRIDFNKNIVLIGALVGTTVGPYSIFLHSEAAAQHWHSTDDIKDMLIDTVISITVGGLISCSIIVVSAITASTLAIQDLSIDNFGKALEAPLGIIGQKIFMAGLFAAGISSAITAPLAASYTITELLSENKVRSNDIKFRCIWCIVLLTGLIIALSNNYDSTNLILFAQYANALVLPLVMVFLLYCLNSPVMGHYKNKLFANILFVAMVIVCILLGIKNFL